MQRENKLKVRRLPQFLMMSLLLAMALTFSACGGGGGEVIDNGGIEEGVGGDTVEE